MGFTGNGQFALYVTTRANSLF